MASVPLHIKAEPKIVAGESVLNRSSSTSNPVCTQTTVQPEVPWESVTLNRCLFIVITILVLTSGIQKLYEALHTNKVSPEDDKYGLIMRRHGVLRHRREMPETTFWELMLSWLPDLDDDDEEDDDEEDEDKEVKVKKRKPKRRRIVKTLSGLRNKPLLENLLKQRDETSKGHKVKKSVSNTEDYGEESDEPEDHAENVDPEEKHSTKSNEEM